MSQPIPIFYTISDNFAPYAAVAIESLLPYVSSDHQYQIIIVHQGLRQATRQNLKSLTCDNVEIIFMKSMMPSWGPFKIVKKTFCEPISSRPASFIDCF